MRSASVSTVALSGRSVNVPAMRRLPSGVVMTAWPASSSGLPNVRFQTSPPDRSRRITQTSAIPAPDDSVLPATTKSPSESRAAAFIVSFPAPPRTRLQTSPPVSFTLTAQASDSLPPRAAVEPTKRKPPSPAGITAFAEAFTSGPP